MAIPMPGPAGVYRIDWMWALDLLSLYCDYVFPLYGLSSVQLHKGLDDIVIKETALSYIDGESGKLYYVGYPIEELAEYSSYEEVCFLLLHQRLPTSSEFREFSMHMVNERGLPPEFNIFIKTIPRQAPMMDILKTAVDFLALYDPELQTHESEANIRKAIRLTAKIPTAIAYSYRHKAGLDIIEPSDKLSHAANFLYMITGEKPDSLASKIMDVAFILHAEHELPASSTAALVVASTLSDLYSAISAGIGALKGPLHGGANERALEMLLSIGRPDRVWDYVKSVLASGGKIMGFGHRVYKSYDPRAKILKRYLETLCQLRGDYKLLEIANTLEEAVRAELVGKPVFPNIDLYSGAVFHMLGLPIEVFTPMFAAARTVGWSSHVIEYWRNNRLIRPRAHYIGPEPRRYVPIELRHEERY